MRGLRARLGLNSLWLFGARLGTQALMVLFTLLLARRLGSSGFGEYALLAATIFIGNMLTTYGTDLLLVREIAARGDFSALSAALLIQLALAALAVGLIVAGAGYFPNQSPAALRGVQIYSLALFPLAFYTVFSAALRGRQQMNVYALLGLASALMQLALVWALPLHSVTTLAAGLLLIQAGMAGLAGWLCGRQIPGFWRKWRFSRTGLRRVLRAGAPLALLEALGGLQQKLGITLLAALGGPALTGGFAAAQKVVEAAKTGHVAAFTALYPMMAQGGTFRQKALRLPGLLLLGAAALAALGLSLLAAPLVTLLYGPDFAPAIPALRILAWALLPYTINTYLTLALTASRKENSVIAALAAGLATLAGLSLWWIPRLGLGGAAWAALASEWVEAGLLILQPGSLPWLRASKTGEVYELPEPP